MYVGVLVCPCSSSWLFFGISNIEECYNWLGEQASYSRYVGLEGHGFSPRHAAT